jgi:hypothetical protein
MKISNYFESILSTTASLFYIGKLCLGASTLAALARGTLLNPAVFLASKLR